MQSYCRMSVSQELTWIFSWNFQRLLKWENQLTKRQYAHAVTILPLLLYSSSTITITPTTTSLATTCKVKSINMKIQEVSACRS